MLSKLLFLNLTLLTGSLCFILGFLYHTELVEGNFEELIGSDPYALHLVEKIQENLDGYLLKWRKKKKSKLQDIMKYGFPGLDDIHVYEDFVLSYDRKNRIAHWVCEHLHSDSVIDTPGVSRREARFVPDMNIPSSFRANTDDFRNSGYDKGHLAAAGNHKAEQNHLNQTFLLSNIAPQVGKGFNRDIWNRLETTIRDLTLRYGSVYVYTGPMYVAKTHDNDKFAIEYELIGNNAVAVPTHFFKVIVIESKLPKGKPYMEAYVLPNKPIDKSTKLRDFICEIGFIERTCGLKFFDGLRRSFFFGINCSNASQLFNHFN